MSIVELPSAPLVPLRRWLRGSRLWQVLLIVGLWIGAEWLVQATHLPIPSGIVGMMILLLLLGRQWWRRRRCPKAPAGCWPKCCCSSCRRR
jgi:hypothetical protein